MSVAAAAPPGAVPFGKRLKRTLRFHLLRALLAVVGLIPLSFAPRLARLLAPVLSALFPGERRKALASLTVAFPEMAQPERLALIGRMWVHLLWAALEMVHLQQLDPVLEQYAELVPEERALLDAAVARGKGLLFVSGHVGNWELLARRIAATGHPSATIAKESNDPRLTGLVERLRASGKVQTIWRGSAGAAREMLRHLKRGGMLGILIDQDTKVQGLFVEFFGKPAFTPRGGSDLALRGGAAVIVGTIHRKPEGGHRVRLQEVTVDPSLEGEAAALAVTQGCTRLLEQEIRAHPEEWVWMHQRWKTQQPPA